MLTVGEPSRGVTYQDVWHPACPATRSKRKSGLKVWPKDGLSDTVSAQAWNFANFSSLTGFDPTTAAGPPPQNFQPRFNVYPTTTIDTIVGLDGKRELVPMRWGLVNCRIEPIRYLLRPRRR